jgi:hypothetical protein
MLVGARMGCLRAQEQAWSSVALAQVASDVHAVATVAQVQVDEGQVGTVLLAKSDGVIDPIRWTQDLLAREPERPVHGERHQGLVLNDEDQHPLPRCPWVSSWQRQDRHLLLVPLKLRRRSDFLVTLPHRRTGPAGGTNGSVRRGLHAELRLRR